MRSHPALVHSGPRLGKGGIQSVWGVRHMDGGAGSVHSSRLRDLGQLLSLSGLQGVPP